MTGISNDLLLFSYRAHIDLILVYIIEIELLPILIVLEPN